MNQYDKIYIQRLTASTDGESASFLLKLYCNIHAVVS